ncbi:SIS domain-containing protein [Pelagibacterium sediminicola]|uniref:SIS domain-containing protein n=1 Tax=Pelagibacterium sediminicola TaxID=2248761 RepID=UPI000E322826|nr:SIS domain-containing protein [Pelagibacterium sediminicola]
MQMTAMRREIGEIPAVVAHLLGEGRDPIIRAASALRKADPRLIATIARGSSDHAATYLKYAAGLMLGLPVATLAPSLASICGVDLKLAGAAAIGISQSGKSPDLVAMLKSARQSGATTLALTNIPASSLAEISDHVIDICAGPERSVAATKTFVTSLVAVLALVAHWSENPDLLAALDTLPHDLEQALGCDWSGLLAPLAGARSLYVLGRGPGLAIASEAALKFKETAGLHAEAYSTAEVLHGPSALAVGGFPVLAFGAMDSCRASILDTANRLAAQGANVFLADADADFGQRLPVARTGHPLTYPIAQIVTFYGFVEALSRLCHFDPDHPPHLNKVTATL